MAFGAPRDEKITVRFPPINGHLIAWCSDLAADQPQTGVAVVRSTANPVSSEGPIVHNAKVASRLIATIAWTMGVSFAAGVLLAGFGYIGTGLVLVLLSGALLPVVIILAIIALARVRCFECGERFFSVAYPVWPFQSACAQCGVSAVR